MIDAIPTIETHMVGNCHIFSMVAVSLSFLSRVPTLSTYLGIVRYLLDILPNQRGPLFKIFTDDIIPKNNLCNPQQFLYAIRIKK